MTKNVSYLALSEDPTLTWVMTNHSVEYKGVTYHDQWYFRNGSRHLNAIHLDMPLLPSTVFRTWFRLFMIWHPFSGTLSTHSPKPNQISNPLPLAFQNPGPDTCSGQLGLWTYTIYSQRHELGLTVTKRISGSEKFSLRNRLRAQRVTEECCTVSWCCCSHLCE